MRRPVRAVHVRHVEVVALVAPALVEDLRELRLRIEVHPQRRVEASLRRPSARACPRRRGTAAAAPAASPPAARPPARAAPCDRAASCRRRSPRTRRRWLRTAPRVDRSGGSGAACCRAGVAPAGSVRPALSRKNTVPATPAFELRVLARSGTPAPRGCAAAGRRNRSARPARAARRGSVGVRGSPRPARRTPASSSLSGSSGLGSPFFSTASTARRSRRGRTTSCRATASAGRNRSRRGTTDTCRSRPTPDTSRRPGRR